VSSAARLRQPPLAVRTPSSSGTGAAWASLVAGVASLATLPLAIYATRFGDEYELLDSAFAIPVAGALALVALGLANRARRLDAIRLSSTVGKLARAGRLLGLLGLCIVASAVVALGVYGLLEYVGSRD
jgi:hypothetical protein